MIMKKIFLFTVLTLLAFYGCVSDFDQFKSEVILFAVSDKYIDQKEYESLIEQIKNSDDKGFKQFLETDQKIDDSKVVAYIIKLCSVKQILINKCDIWTPESLMKLPKSNFNINVYLENTGSMNGFSNAACVCLELFENSRIVRLDNILLFDFWS